jgi:hypothetical protein
MENGPSWREADKKFVGVRELTCLLQAGPAFTIARLAKFLDNGAIAKAAASRRTPKGIVA